MATATLDVAVAEGLLRSRFAILLKVAQRGRELAISRLAQNLETDVQLRSVLWELSLLRQVCHCTERQRCHADELIIAAFVKDFHRLTIETI